MEYDNLVEIRDRIHRIINSDLEWVDKYDMIFSDDISMKFHLDYYDPDTSYEEDVLAWVQAFESYFKKQTIIYTQINYG